MADEKGVSIPARLGLESGEQRPLRPSLRALQPSRRRPVDSQDAAGKRTARPVLVRPSNARARGGGGGRGRTRVAEAVLVVEVVRVVVAVEDLLDHVDGVLLGGKDDALV